MTKKPDEPVVDPLAAAAAESEQPKPAEDAHPILSADQLQAAKDKARKLIEAERIKAATQQVIDEETSRLRQEEGLVTGIGAKDEMVSITLDLAEHSDRIVLSGRPYYHGHTYTVQRHIADTLREIQDRGHRHQEEEVEGKGRYNAYRRTREEIGKPTLLSMRTGAAVNAPATPA